MLETLVPTSVTVTLAPGMTAPVGSITLPVILPRDSCAKQTVPASNNTAQTTRARFSPRSKRSIEPPYKANPARSGAEHCWYHCSGSGGGCSRRLGTAQVRPPGRKRRDGTRDLDCRPTKMTNSDLQLLNPWLQLYYNGQIEPKRK